MIFVKGAEFLMGGETPEGSGWSSSEPKHMVKVRDFYLSKYQVTQEFWKLIMGDNPSNFKKSPKSNQYPVESITWNETIRFCNKLSELTNLTSCYRIVDKEVICNWFANGYRLPTEAEWEYAATGLDFENIYNEHRFYAVSYHNSGINFLSGKWDENQIRINKCEPKPVGSLRPSKLGFYDLVGNVWEYCWDWYHPYTQEEKTQIYPTGPLHGSERMIRGGSYYNDKLTCFKHVRAKIAPDSYTEQMGFRICRSEIEE